MFMIILIFLLTITCAFTTAGDLLGVNKSTASSDVDQVTQVIVCNRCEMGSPSQPDSIVDVTKATFEVLFCPT